MRRLVHFVLPLGWAVLGACAGVGLEQSGGEGASSGPGAPGPGDSTDPTTTAEPAACRIVPRDDILIVRSSYADDVDTLSFSLPELQVVIAGGRLAGIEGATCTPIGSTGTEEACEDTYDCAGCAITVREHKSGAHRFSLRGDGECPELDARYEFGSPPADAAECRSCLDACDGLAGCCGGCGCLCVSECGECT